MKNHKQMLADFYLELLTIPVTSQFRLYNQRLYANVLETLAWSLGEEQETVQRIFERMAQEDKANG